MRILFSSENLLLTFLIFTNTNCAYFNTFYNAKQYFEEAENIRIEKDGKDIPITAIEKYGKAITNCKRVLEYYPESKHVVEATLLMAKSLYYKKDYEVAINNLTFVYDNGNDSEIEESRYWLALCKWKKGSVQASLNELNLLLDNGNLKKLQAKYHLSLANIHNEIGDEDLSLYHLQNAAKFSKGRNEKTTIYNRLAEMAFNRNDLQLAEDSYRNIISNSISKENIENAHLQILKILRMQNEYRLAEKKIKGMLTDDKFSRIAGELELELVQLYKSQGEIPDIETRLESIVNDYQRTKVSAEAYYQLGKIYISEKWDLKKAKEYFEMVSKESSRSLFSPLAKNYSKAISVYEEAIRDIQYYNNKDNQKIFSQNDTTHLSVSRTDSPSKELPELYYQIADLEAFSFNRKNKAIEILNKIINQFPDSPFKPKALFSLVFIYETLSEKSLAKDIKEIILLEFPDSDYATYLSYGISSGTNEQKQIINKAEKELGHNVDNAIKLYRSAIALDSLSEFSLFAAYSIGYYFDQAAAIDSALKYYTWVNDIHPNTNQAKEANKRVNILNNALSIIAADTVDSNIQDKN